MPYVSHTLEETSKTYEEMKMTVGIIKVLQRALQGAEKDRKRLLDELKKIRENSDKLREIIYNPYQGDPDEKLPGEFENPDSFLAMWDATDRALGNTILMVMPRARTYDNH